MFNARFIRLLAGFRLRHLVLLALTAGAAAAALLAPAGANAAAERVYEANFTTPCVLGPRSLNIETTATISVSMLNPAVVEEQAQFSPVQTSVTIRTPVELTEAWSALGATQITGSVINLVVHDTNAEPETFNIARPSAFPEGLPYATIVEPGRELTSLAPSGRQTFSWGPLTAMGTMGGRLILAFSPEVGFTEGETGYIATGAGIIMTESAYANGKRVLGPLSLVCNVPTRVVLAEVPIRSEAPNENPCTLVEGPNLSAIEPSHGPATGGTHVTLTGYDLGAVSGVTVGGQSVPFTLLTSSTILITTPPGKGTVEVNIASPPVRCSIGSRPESFTYESIQQLTFSKWTLAGTLTPKPLGQAIALPSGSSFNGSGELNTETNEGTVSGSVSVPPFKATPKLFGFVPTTLGMTVTQSGAISGTVAPSKTVSGDETLTLPVNLKLGFTSLGLLGLNIPTKCMTSQPVSLTLTDTLTKEALLSKGWSFSGTATIPKITCEGGLLGAFYGEVISGLISGAGASYSLSVTAPGS